MVTDELRIRTKRRRKMAWVQLLAACGYVVMALGACGPTELQETRDSYRALAQAVEDSAGTGPLISPEFSLPSGAGVQWQKGIAVAGGGDIYLAVWEERSLGSASDLRGVRVRASDGVVLDSIPLCIACVPGQQTYPSIAFNGSDFLVAWRNIPSSDSTRYAAVHSVRVRASDGAVLGPPMVHTPSMPPTGAPVVASDGSNFLLVWDGQYLKRIWDEEGGYWYKRWASGILARRVSSDGTVSATFPITPNTKFHQSVIPAVAYGGGNYGVVWGEGGKFWDDAGVAAARVRASDGELLDPYPRVLSAEGSTPAVAFDGSQFLAVWNTPTGELRGARMGGDGTVLDPGGFLVGQGEARLPANVAFDGQDYRVIWERRHARPDKVVRRLWTTRVTPGGDVASGEETALAELDFEFDPYRVGDRQAIATLAGRGRFLVGYRQNDTSSGVSLPLVKLRWVEDMPNGEACTQDAACRSDFCVDGVCCESACGGGVGTDCQACSVAAGGVADGACGVVRAEAAVVCRAPAVACDVAEVCDGAGAACPADEPPPREPDLSGDKCEDTPCDVASFLAGLGEEELQQPFGRSLEVKAQQACHAWQEGDAQAARGKLRALLNEVQAQRGKKLSAPVADMLSAALLGLLASP